MFDFSCVKCNRSEKKDVQIVPKRWATITTFRDESGKYFLCPVCKDSILVHLPNKAKK